MAGTANIKQTRPNRKRRVFGLCLRPGGNRILSKNGRGPTNTLVNARCGASIGHIDKGS
jgi:hypothetical protein